jgi:hypothetical protein
MRVALGEFACFCVASRFGADLSAGIESAARFYTRKLSSQGESGSWTRLPKRLDSPFLELDVPLDSALIDRLEREAETRSVDVQQLLNHAVFVYCAELDREF